MAITLDNLRLVTRNWADYGVSITASTAVMTPENLKVPKLYEIWRTQPGTSHSIQSDLYTSRPISCLAVLNYNFTGTGTVSLQLSNVSDLSSPLFDNTSSPWSLQGHPTTPTFDETCRQQESPYENLHDVFWLDQVYSARYWRVAFTLPTSQVFELGRIFVSDYWEPEFNMDYGASLSWNDPSILIRTRGGSPWAVRHIPYRVFRATISNIRQAQAVLLMDLLKYRGIRNDIVLSGYTNFSDTANPLVNIGGKTTFPGHIMDLSPLTHTQGNLGTIELVVEEAV